MKPFLQLQKFIGNLNTRKYGNVQFSFIKANVDVWEPDYGTTTQFFEGEHEVKAYEINVYPDPEYSERMLSEEVKALMLEHFRNESGFVVYDPELKKAKLNSGGSIWYDEAFIYFLNKHAATIRFFELDADGNSDYIGYINYESSSKDNMSE